MSWKPEKSIKLQYFKNLKFLKSIWNWISTSSWKRIITILSKVFLKWGTSLVQWTNSIDSTLQSNNYVAIKRVRTKMFGHIYLLFVWKTVEHDFFFQCIFSVNGIAVIVNHVVLITWCSCYVCVWCYFLFCSLSIVSKVHCWAWGLIVCFRMTWNWVLYKIFSFYKHFCSQKYFPEVEVSFFQETINIKIWDIDFQTFTTVREMP
jgi:hypothetical protein